MQLKVLDQHKQILQYYFVQLLTQMCHVIGGVSVDFHKVDHAPNFDCKQKRVCNLPTVNCHYTLRMFKLNQI